MNPPAVGFAGMTHLGINSGAAAAARGFETLWYDTDPVLISQLEHGRLPVMEPGLADLIQQHAGQIRFSSDRHALQKCDLIYVASDVPTDDNGASNLVGVQALIDSVLKVAAPDTVIIVLCQVPPAFTRALDWPLERLYYQVETLVFGQAVERAMRPERFIIGCANPAQPLPEQYRLFLDAFGCPIFQLRYESAELAKIAINCCLAASVAVSNTLAELSERIEADWHEIIPVLRLDKRIGQYAYLSPGLGLAGGNIERDLSTVLRLARETGSEAGVIASFIKNSRYRKDWVLRVLHREVLLLGRRATLAILGLTYKENTHSTRNSAALDLIRHLKPWPLRIHDPVVNVEAVKHPNVVGCETAIEAARDADALVIMTPWPAFRSISADELARTMKGRIVIDPYRVLNGEVLWKTGFDYFALGEPPNRQPRDTRRA